MGKILDSSGWKILEGGIIDRATGCGQDIGQSLARKIKEALHGYLRGEGNMSRALMHILICQTAILHTSFLC